MVLSLNPSQLIPGMVLRQHIINDNGDEVFISGTKLDDSHIYWLTKCYNGNEVLVEEPRLHKNFILTDADIKRGVYECLTCNSHMSSSYKLLSILLSSMGGYFNKTLQQLLGLKKFDNITFEHCMNVAWYSLYIGHLLELSESDMNTLFQAAILHDIGKSFISRNILGKSGKLSLQEFEIIKLHSTYGSTWAEHLVGKNTSKIIGMHHEYLNGEGYPNGLKAEDIPRLSRIITIADIFDSLISKRVYKKKVSPFSAYSILIVEANKGKIDKDIVDVFKEVLNLLRDKYLILDNTEHIGINNSLPLCIIAICMES